MALPGLGLKGSLLLALAGFAGLMDTAFLLGVVAAYAEHLGASKAEAGFIAGLYSMVAIPASLAAGLAVDKVGRKKALVAGLAWDTLAIALYTTASTPGELALYRALHAIGGSLVYPAFFSIVGDAGGRGREGSAAGRYLAVVGAAVALGSAGGGRAAEALGFQNALRLLALILALGTAAAIALPYRDPGVIRRGGVARGLAASKARVLGAAATMASLYLGFGVLVGGLSTALTGEGVAGGEEEASAVAGMAIGLASLTSLPAFLLAGRLIDAGRGALAIASATASALAGASLLAQAHSAGEVALFAALYGPLIGAGMTLSTYLAITVPPWSRGTSVAVQQVSNILGVALGAPLGGILSGAMGLEGIAVGVSLSTLLLAFSSLLALRAAGARSSG
ncbi:MFS transporter [Aeropyrum camini]|uniref:MFS transporter n=2 Tax=Aeropyrum camini TaxID=229980 RepID=U3TAY2_9CREN|nr:MFS transporter [Aeropyrum camini]BAN90672.1 MFS transporter [Aeropyrum camini SY1 = JCM 12091]